MSKRVSQLSWLYSVVDTRWERIALNCVYNCSEFCGDININNDFWHSVNTHISWVSRGNWNRAARCCFRPPGAFYGQSGIHKNTISYTVGNNKAQRSHKMYVGIRCHRGIAFHNHEDHNNLWTWSLMGEWRFQQFHFQCYCQKQSQQLPFHLFFSGLHSSLVEWPHHKALQVASHIISQLYCPHTHNWTNLFVFPSFSIFSLFLLLCSVRFMFLSSVGEWRDRY